MVFVQLKETGIFWNKYRQLHELYYNPLPEGEEDKYADLPGLIGWDEGNDTVAADPQLELLDNTDSEILDLIADTLRECQPYPNDSEGSVDPSYHQGADRFIVEPAWGELVCVYDQVRGFEAYLYWELARSNLFSVGKWFAEQCTLDGNESLPEEVTQEWMSNQKWEQMVIKLTKRIPKLPSMNGDEPPDDDHRNDSPDDHSD